VLIKRNFKIIIIKEHTLSEKKTSLTTNNSYSQALFELAKENNSLVEIEDQVVSLVKLISKSSEFKEIIKNPINKIKDLQNAIKLISDKFKFNELLKKFLVFVISKRRFFYIEKILKDFLSICSNSRGEIQAEITVAKEMNEQEIIKVKNELDSNFGSNIKLNYKYDPSLIGGLVLKVGSTMVDTSIKNKLQQIEKKMIEA